MSRSIRLEALPYHKIRLGAIKVTTSAVAESFNQYGTSFTCGSTSVIRHFTIRVVCKHQVRVTRFVHLSVVDVRKNVTFKNIRVVMNVIQIHVSFSLELCFDIDI